MTPIAPIGELLGIHEARLLRTLISRAEPLSGRHLAKLSEVPASTAARILTRFAALGIVDARPSSHATTFEINREHILYAPILALFEASAELESRLRALVRSRGGDAVTAAIFGSVARDDATLESDLDIVLVFPDDFDSDQHTALLDEIMTSLNRASGRQVQIYDIDRSGLAEMAERSDPLVERLREEAIPITGTPIATLLRAAA